MASIDWQFVAFYSFGGAIVMSFVEPWIWVLAALLGRNSLRRPRFWAELPFGMAAAVFFDWRENGFATMANLSGTAMSIQFIRPALAALWASLLASLVWSAVGRLSAQYRSPKRS